mgnify:CR=1 FL=1
MSMSKAGDAKSRELIQTVSQISNGLMNEVSKVTVSYTHLTLPTIYSV